MIGIVKIKKNWTVKKLVFMIYNCHRKIKNMKNLILEIYENICNNFK